jgi:hypothetical protein
MGRAIEVDKRLDKLEHQINEIFLILDEISKVGTKQEHIDIHEETKQEKTNNEGSRKSSGKSNNGKSKAKTASDNNSTGSK